MEGDNTGGGGAMSMDWEMVAKCTDGGEREHVDNSQNGGEADGY